LGGAVVVLVGVEDGDECLRGACDAADEVVVAGVRRVEDADEQV
jgi:hypothetical protein